MGQFELDCIVDRARSMTLLPTRASDATTRIVTNQPGIGVPLTHRAIATSALITTITSKMGRRRFMVCVHATASFASRHQQTDPYPGAGLDHWAGSGGPHGGPIWPSVAR